MAKTHRPAAAGLITKYNLCGLAPGMVLRLFLPAADGKHWNWYDIQYVSHDDQHITVYDSLKHNSSIKYSLATLGIIPSRNGKYFPGFICVRDEFLGLRKVS
jgi:hypothetical protein